MPDNYKKWILIGIAFLVGIFFAMIVIAPSFKNREVKEPVAQEPVISPSQSADLAFKEVLPVEKLGVNDSDPQILAGLGDQYFESSNYLQAIKIYQKVLELDPNDTDTYNDLGLAYHYTGNSGLAEEVLLKGIDTGPDYQRIWLTLGYVLMSTGKNEQARPVLQRAFDLDPDNEVGQEALRMLGQI
jgi:tetratricopeptide (TPR) repeat protein